MALDNLKEDLYATQKKDRGHEKTVYNPDIARTAKGSLGDESPWQIKERQGIGRAYRRPLLWIAIGFALFVLAMFLIWTVMSVRSGLFSPGRTIISVEGPRVVQSGIPVSYVITYDNQNGTKLRGSVLTINHSPQFTLDPSDNLVYEGISQSRIDIGLIKPGETKEITVSGVFAAGSGGELYIEPRLAYRPSVRLASYVASKRFGVSIDTKTFRITANAQQAVANGDILEYVIHYKNLSDRLYDDIDVVAQFPQGFTMQSAEPVPTFNDNVWSLGAVDSGVEGTIRVKGTLTGIIDDVKPATFIIGKADGDTVTTVYGEAEWIARVAQMQLIVRHFANNDPRYITHAGDKLRYEIAYKNTSDLGMRDVIIRLKFDDRVLDYSRLDLTVSGGSLEPSTRSVVWRAADVPELSVLEPGEQGSIFVSIPVREQLPAHSENDKNLVVKTFVEIDSPDVPTPIGANKIVSSNKLNIKIASPVTFTTEGFYDDFTLKNTGPYPPTLNVKTTFTLRMTLSNGTNKLENARVETSLPSSVRWEGVTFPDDEKIQFNVRTNKLVWDIGDVNFGTGYYRKKREIRFQVSVTPTINQLGDPVPLLQDATFRARDLHTGQMITAQTRFKDTTLPEDSTIKGLSGSVTR